MPKAVEHPEMIEREYGKYHAKIYFAKEDVPGTEEELMDSIMESYRQRMEKKELHIAERRRGHGEER